MPEIKRDDCVTSEGSSRVGVVQRVARNGHRAKVKQGRRQRWLSTDALTVQTTISLGGGWQVTDETRERELHQ